MRALSKLFVLLLATFALASCGGGGGGSKGAFTPTPSDTIDISAASTSITTNSFTTLTVTVKKADGSFENDGVAVNAAVSPSTIGTVAGKTGSPAGQTASNTLSGGTTTFNFSSSNQSGTATVTVSLPAGTNGSTTVATKSIPITVASGNTQDPRLQLTATATTLPVSPFDYGQQQQAPFPGNFIGSPYVAEVTVTWRHANGQLVSGTSQVNASVQPTQFIALSSLNKTGDEFHTLLGSGPIDVTAGVGTIFIHSNNVPGTGVLTVTAPDPDNGNQTISSQLQFTIAGGAGNLPTSINATGGAAYVSNSGGPQSAVVSAIVKDGNGALVPDPSGFDNVKFEIAGPANNDGRLSGVNAAGQAVTGGSITTVTHNGVASASFLAGTQQGPVQVKVTADRGDNNVDNGIQDAVSATATVVVSDGKLFSLTLTGPDTNAILANTVSGDVSTSTSTIPPDPNGTYSLTVSALATDRQGNPVLPGTVVKFGSIDAPLTDGFFSISGTQGNPQEGGTFFTATDGHFRTAGGGAGPGDTVIVFGKDVPGNSDLESAAKVARVNSDVSLNVTTPFNLNDTTGVSVDSGFVLPYIVGRAQTGNITSPSTTNAVGVATTTLNYPVSALGRIAAIWAQSNGTDTLNHTNVVTDAAVLVFPGIAPAKIIISPDPIPGDITTTVFACIYDALDSPISGVHFNFSFNNLGIGSGTLDGITGAGVVPDATDASGCVATTVTTVGIASGTGGGGSTGTPNLTFSVGATSASADITAGGALALLANPSALGGNGGKVTLTLVDSHGNPVPGVQIVGSCSGDPSIGLSQQPGVTDANGKTTATITASLDGVGGGKTGSCVFTTTSGSPTATVTLQGVDACLTSPQPPSCTGSTTPTTHNIVVNLNPGTSGYGNVVSAPAGINCTMASAAVPVSCSFAFPANQSIALTATLLGPATSVTWTGSCAGAGTSLTASINSSTDKTCGITFNP